MYYNSSILSALQFLRLEKKRAEEPNLTLESIFQKTQHKVHPEPIIPVTLLTGTIIWVVFWGVLELN
jgi:hypothetical protein